MLRFVTNILPCRKTLLVLLILLTVSLLRHTFTPATVLQTNKAPQQKSLLFAQIPFQAGHSFYKESGRIPNDKNTRDDSPSLNHNTTELLITPIEYKLFDWHMLLYQRTLHKRDYA